MSGRRVSCAASVLFLLACPVTAARADGGTTYTWVGNTVTAGADNHSWTDSNNWSPVGVPGDGDSVIITQPSNDDCFAHVDAVPTVELTNVTLTQNPALCTTSVSGGAISITGALTWNGGTLDTPTTIESSATGAVSGSGQEPNALAQDLDVDGTLTLTGVTGSGALQITHPQILRIEPGAMLVSSGSNEIGGDECCVGPAKVVNDGTLSIDNGTFTIATTELDQNGTVTTSSGGRLVTSAAPVSVAPGGTYQGNGGWSMQAGSSAHFGGTQTLGHNFDLELGGLALDSSSTLAGKTTLAGTGTFDWTGGLIEADLTIAHSVTMRVDGVHTGNGRRILAGEDLSGGGAGVPVTQTNHGTITVGNGAAILTADEAHLVNAGNATISLAPGTALSSEGCCVHPDRLSNTGTLVVAAGPGTGPAVIDGVAYEAVGGATAIATGRTLQLTGGAPNKLTATTVTGGGNLSVTGPTAVSGAISLAAKARLLLGVHGSLDGTATLSGPGSVRWTGGSMSGDIRVSSAGGFSIAGSDTKSIANVGGGSTPSRVTLGVPTAIAAGTSHAPDVVSLGHSTLILASSTTVGAFTEFESGTLINRGTLALHRGKVTAATFQQSAQGTLAVDLAKPAHGLLQVSESASLHGAAAAHNSLRPALGARVTILKAPTIAGSLSCVATSGTASGGAHPGHWSAAQTAARLTLVWKRGAHPSC